MAIAELARLCYVRAYGGLIVGDKFARVGVPGNGAPSQLEGIPQAFARLLRGCALSGQHHIRARLLPHPQPLHRQSRPAPVRRRGERRSRRDRGPSQGLRGRQGRVHHRRGRRAEIGAAREQPHHRHRALRTPRADQRALLRHALLSSRPPIASARKPSPSSARRCVRRRWSASPASCCSAASDC